MLCPGQAVGNHYSRKASVWNGSEDADLVVLRLPRDDLMEFIASDVGRDSLIQEKLEQMVEDRRRKNMQSSNKPDQSDYERCLKLLNCGHKSTCTIGDICKWEMAGEDSKYTVSRWRHSWWYRTVSDLFCWLHMGLTLIEAPAGAEPLSSRDVEHLEDHWRLSMILGGVCIAVLWVDIALYWHAHDGLKRYETPPLPQPSLAADLPLLTLRQRQKRLEKGTHVHHRAHGHLLALVGVLVLITVDYIVQLALGTSYTTGPQPQDSFDHAVLLLPYTAVLRPAVLILRSDSLRTGTFSFLRTMQQSATIFLLFFWVLAVFGVLSVVLFAEDTTMFGDIFAATSALFTYMSTAENWPDAVWPTTSCEHSTGHYSGLCWKYLFHFYFMVASLMGTIVMVSLIIATFEFRYTEQHKAQQEEKRARTLEGIVAAYAILDRAGTNKLSMQQTGEFFAHCDRPQLQQLKLGKGTGIVSHMRLSVTEFAELCEPLLPELRKSNVDHDQTSDEVEKSLNKNLGDDHHEERHAEQPYIESTFHAFLMFLVSVVQCVSLASINTNHLPISSADIVCAVCVTALHLDVSHDALLGMACKPMTCKGASCIVVLLWTGLGASDLCRRPRRLGPPLGVLGRPVQHLPQEEEPVRPTRLRLVAAVPRPGRCPTSVGYTGRRRRRPGCLPRVGGLEPNHAGTAELAAVLRDRKDPCDLGVPGGDPAAVQPRLYALVRLHVRLRLRRLLAPRGPVPPPRRVRLRHAPSQLQLHAGLRHEPLPAVHRRGMERGQAGGSRHEGRLHRGILPGLHPVHDRHLRQSDVRCAAKAHLQSTCLSPTLSQCYTNN